jgi:hypothetical protein
VKGGRPSCAINRMKSEPSSLHTAQDCDERDQKSYS